MSEINLPAWAKLVPHDRRVIVEVDSDKAYEALLAELKVEDVDQYWLEVAYQCIKMDVQAALEVSPLSPLRSGVPAQINFTRAPRWALEKHKPGKGVPPATKGREARDHYKLLRGRIPFS